MGENPLKKKKKKGRKKGERPEPGLAIKTPRGGGEEGKERRPNFNLLDFCRKKKGGGMLASGCLPLFGEEGEKRKKERGWKGWVW